MTTTIDFLRQSYDAIWQDPRMNSAHMEVSKKITIDDIKEWDILNWVIRNVVAFWAFVDVWLKSDWLVHVSQMKDERVNHPSDVVKEGEILNVKLLEIDQQGRLKLTMKNL